MACEAATSAADAKALAGHAEHAPAPAELKVPIGHGEQLGVPVATLSEKVPCEHDMHAHDPAGE
jgi:hypothetical protein